jgi:hypothetical protein
MHVIVWILGGLAFLAVLILLLVQLEHSWFGEEENEDIRAIEDPMIIRDPENLNDLD